MRINGGEARGLVSGKSGTRQQPADGNTSLIIVGRLRLSFIFYFYWGGFLIPRQKFSVDGNVSIYSIFIKQLKIFET